MEQSQILQRFQKDSEWFYKNIDSLRKQGFVGKFVAIKNSKPIVSDKNVDLVIKKLDENGENPSFLFIEFVHPEGFTLIL
jgi:hypothetical protein